MSFNKLIFGGLVLLLPAAPAANMTNTKPSDTVITNEAPETIEVEGFTYVDRVDTKPLRIMVKKVDKLEKDSQKELKLYETQQEKIDSSSNR